MNLDNIKQPFIDIFPGDFSGNNVQRQTPEVLFALVDPVTFDNAELLHFNEQLSKEIGLGIIESEQDENFLNSNFIPPQLKPYSTAYAGHQFGNWAGQLGDGRAIFAGEISTEDGKRTEIQWKGAGATPYSRHADGRAVLRSTVREYLMSEYMHHLGVPTTRSLSISLTGEAVMRDVMYDGHPANENGAVMIRTAESFLRFGHFELVSARNQPELLRKLTDFAIENYFPHISSEKGNKYLAFFNEVAHKTADLIVEWFRVGFVHGVMNTDNMSVLGLTIDYGPFSLIDEYDLSFTSNTTDLPGRRYAFGEQGKIAQWNLWQLANALFPLINDAEKLEQILNNFGDYFWKKHDEMLRRKFGFETEKESDTAFFVEWQNMMQDIEIDFHLFFTRLESYDFETSSHFSDVFYRDLNDTEQKSFSEFLQKYKDRLSENEISREEAKNLMKKANPKFILRNYLLFECAEQLNKGSRQLFDQLFEALQNPYQETHPEFSGKRPSKYDGVVGCTSLSCSS